MKPLSCPQTNWAHPLTEKLPPPAVHLNPQLQQSVTHSFTVVLTYVINLPFILSSVYFYLVYNCLRFQAGKAQGHRWVWALWFPGHTDPLRTGKACTLGTVWPLGEAEQLAATHMHMNMLTQRGDKFNRSVLTIFTAFLTGSWHYWQHFRVSWEE